MNNDKINTLCTHLEQEISWVGALNALLAEEKKLLENRQFNLLEECASKKQDLSSKLEDSATQRARLISTTELNTTSSLQNFLKECSDAEVMRVTGLNNTLTNALAICRELNSVNGQVIANNLYVRQEIVNTLSGNKADAVSVYNAHGSLSSSQDNNSHHQEA